MEKLSLEYIAGLVDADGSISISTMVRKGKPQFSFVINLRLIQKHKNVLEDVQHTLEAGKIYDHKAYSKTATSMSSWQTTKQADTLKVCELLLPFLRIKKKEAILMIQALTVWETFGLKHKTVDAKEFIMNTARQMNESQQKETRLANRPQNVVI